MTEEKKNQKEPKKQMGNQCLMWKEGRFIILRAPFLLILEPTTTENWTGSVIAAMIFIGT